MTRWQKPGNGDSEIAAPVEVEEAAPAVDAGVAAAEEAPSEEPSAAAGEVADAEVAWSKNRARPNPLLLIGAAILVVLAAQLVMTWFALGVAREARDQTTIANGLQHCVIQAQLNENSATDTSGSTYRAAVQACLNK